MLEIKTVLKWDLKDFLQVILGIFLFTFAINIFVVPNSLYNGGILGISQLIRSLIESVLPWKFNFDMAGIINFLFNIPLFIIAYKFVSRTFFYRTLICVSIQTFFLTIIPVPEVSIVPEILTSVLIGGILAGIGNGMLLSSGGSGGGTDIVGLIISTRHNGFSVGRINGFINITIYCICGILYGIPIMIYSIIYAFIDSLIIDHTHKQNICSYVMIFTKEKPYAIRDFIREYLDRDITYWEAYGGYDYSKTYILYSAMSKYEMQRLERQLPEISPDAFMIKSEGIGINGKFEKKLTP
jgi:uncharacterized membrane-anchored protein YitT (DUF2179 family)